MSDIALIESFGCRVLDVSRASTPKEAMDGIFVCIIFIIWGVAVFYFGSYAVAKKLHERKFGVGYAIFAGTVVLAGIIFYTGTLLADTIVVMNASGEAIYTVKVSADTDMDALQEHFQVTWDNHSIVTIKTD